MKQRHIQAFTDKQSQYSKEVFAGLLTKFKSWESFQNSLDSEIDESFLQDMTKTNNYKKRQQACEKRTGQEVTRLISQGKLPAKSNQEYRKEFAMRAMQFLDEVVPRMKAVLKGSKKAKRLSKKEQRLTSAAVLVLLICLSRPARAVDLLSMTATQLEELIDKKIIYFRTKKASVKESTSFISIQTCPQLIMYLRYQLDIIGNYLRLGGGFHVAKKIKAEDLQLMRPFIEMNNQDFLTTQLKNGSVTIKTRDQRFKEGWLHIEKQVKTPGLTLSQLRRKYLQDTVLCPHVFVDADGKHMKQISTVFKECAQTWTKTNMGLTLFRKYIDSAMIKHSNQTTSIALDHTTATAEKHYRMCNMKEVVDEWDNIYKIGNDAEEGN